MSFVPSIGGFEANAAANLKGRGDPPGILEISRTHEASPVELRWIGNNGERFDRSLQESGERSEGSLTVLILSEIVVRLERLKPHSCFDLVARAGVEDVIVNSVEIARRRIVGPDVGPGACDLRRAVGSGRSRDYDSSSRFSCEKAGSVGLD